MIFKKKKEKRKSNWITLNPNHIDPTLLSPALYLHQHPVLLSNLSSFFVSLSLSSTTQLSESTLVCSKSSLLVHFENCVMASFSFKCGSCFSGFNETILSSQSNKASCFSTPSTSLDSKASSSSKKFPVLTFEFLGKPLVVPYQNGSRNCATKPENKFSVQVCQKPCFTFGFQRFFFSGFILF